MRRAWGARVAEGGREGLSELREAEGGCGKLKGAVGGYLPL